MKKVYLIGALSGLLLASCANDDLVVKTAPSSNGEAPVSFAMNIGNMSRAGSALNDVGFNSFGVWAVKAADQADFLGLNLGLGTIGSEHAQVVMDNYWVKYCTSEHYGSFWSYVPGDWADPSILPSGRTAQYLKYWDGSFAKTYFVAYGPGVDDVTFDNDAGSANPTMTFPVYDTAADPLTNYIYSDIKECTNSEYINPLNGTTENPKKVSLQFYRLLSQVKIAFWESIDGYSVELNEITFNDGHATTAGVAAMPAKVNDSGVWKEGAIVNRAQPVVTYDKGTSADPDVTSHANVSVAYTDAYSEYKMLDFATPAGNIGTSRPARTYSSTVYNVLPNSADARLKTTMKDRGSVPENDGLQFVVNYTLKSEDSKEKIKVQGARVFVPADFTSWKENTVYTYIFQITKNSSGTTTDTKPDPKPDDPEDALYPIIFDGLKVVDLETDTEDFVINQKLTDLYINIYDLTSPYDPTTLSLRFAPDDVTYTWESVTPEVATVTPKSPTTSADVTPVDIGTSVINVKDSSNKVVASCTVYVFDCDLTALSTGVAASVTVGSTTTLTNPFPYPLTSKSKWTTSDATKATVSSSGEVTGVATGTVTITCSSTINDATYKQTWTLTVNP